MQDYEGEPATVGVYSGGLVVYKNSLRVRRISWVSVIQVSYKRSYFNINVRHAEVSDLRQVMCNAGIIIILTSPSLVNMFRVN